MICGGTVGTVTSAFRSKYLPLLLLKCYIFYYEKIKVQQLEIKRDCVLDATLISVFL